MDRQVKVAVIGCGLIGVSSAIRILEAVPNSSVTIFTEQVMPSAAGDVAAGFWTPIHLSSTPTELSDRWCEQTFRFLQSVMELDPRPSEHGLSYCPGYKVFTSEQPPKITWSHVPLGFRRISDSELRMFPQHVRSGVSYVSIVAEAAKFIPYLLDRFYKLGGRLVANHRVGSFEELESLGFRRIVNCGGLEAGRLCNDKEVVPIRGQMLRVQAPWMNFWIIDGDTYCLPNSNAVAVGSVAQSGNWSLEASAKDREDILSRVYRLWPPLRSAKVIGEGVGLRPGRSSVRVERQRVGSGCTVYHNYGHSGCGTTLFWGCANDLVQLMLEDLDSATSRL